MTVSFDKDIISKKSHITGLEQKIRLTTYDATQYVNLKTDGDFLAYSVESMKELRDFLNEIYPVEEKVITTTKVEFDSRVGKYEVIVHTARECKPSWVHSDETVAWCKNRDDAISITKNYQ